MIYCLIAHWFAQNRAKGRATAAFSHGLEEVIEHILKQSLPIPSATSPHHLAALWFHYEEPEATLRVIARLSKRVCK